MIRRRHVYVVGGTLHGAAVRCTRCRTTSPVLEVGAEGSAAHRHFNTHCTRTVISLDSVETSGSSVRSSAQRSAPGSRYSGRSSDAFSVDSDPTKQNFLKQSLNHCDRLVNLRAVTRVWEMNKGPKTWRWLNELEQIISQFDTWLFWICLFRKNKFVYDVSTNLRSMA